MLNRIDESRHPSLLLTLAGKHLVFCHKMLAVFFLNMPFIKLKKFPSIHSLLWIFIMNGCWIFSTPFSASKRLMWFFFFNLSILWNILIDYYMSNWLYIPGISPTWSWCIIRLYVAVFDKVLLRVFVIVFTRYTGLLYSFLVMSLASFGDTDLI